MRIYFVDAFAFFCFAVLLVASVYMLTQFYICDGHDCKTFIDAEKYGEEDDHDYVRSVIDGLGFDGVWPIPYIGAAILTPLALYLMRIPITTRNFGLLFFISFVIVYFMFTFYNHHYVKFVGRYISRMYSEAVDRCSASDDRGAVGGDGDEEGEQETE